ncbi:MAG: hypothetical protein ABW195_07710 [Ilumatobacteraceae bacterium]
MRHTSRIRVLAVLASLSIAVVACGDDGAPGTAPAPTATLPPVTTVPPTTTPPVPTAPGVPEVVYAIAAGPDDVVISVTNEGGFVPREVNFTRTPTAMVTGDGRSLSTGPVIAIYPGPLLPNVLERSITPDATQRLLALADQLGLLADVTYARNDQIADAPDTVVEITVDGTTYRHQAYALGIDDEDDPARAALAAFVAAMSDLTTTVGADQLGPDGPYVSEDYLIQATPIDPATLSVDVEPTLQPWPADAPVRLADAAECAEVPVAEFEPLFADATVLSFFTESDVTYQVSVVPQIPGRTC